MSSRGEARVRRRRALVGVVAVAIALAACTSTGPSAGPATTAISTTPTKVETRVDDGVLRIGVLVPASGEGAAIGQSARAAVRVAVDRANSSGGVNRHPVQLVIRDEGADEATAAASLRQLVEAQVDVIVGPASSKHEVALASAIVGAGVAACSPSASALELDQFPSRKLLFRTIASDSLQAEAMAEVVEQTGESSVAIGYLDDAYGRPFAKALESALRRRNLIITAFVGFAFDDDELAPEATSIVAAGPGAIALIGDSNAGSRMLVALGNATASAPRNIVVNDALRRPMSLSVLSAITAETRAKIMGVSQSVLAQSDDLLEAIRLITNQPATGLFATQAYDCATLLMLAAVQGSSTQADVIASQMSAASRGGSACDSFVKCNSLLTQGRNIDYDGPDGFLQLAPNGDLDIARFDEFSFDSSGRDVTTQAFTVSAVGV